MFEMWLFITGVAAGALLAWSPRIVLLRALRRITALEEASLSDRNKRASRARWDAKPEDDPEVQKLLAAKDKPVHYDNEFTTGREW